MSAEPDLRSLFFTIEDPICKLDALGRILLNIRPANVGDCESVVPFSGAELLNNVRRIRHTFEQATIAKPKSDAPAASPFPAWEAELAAVFEELDRLFIELDAAEAEAKRHGFRWSCATVRLGYATCMTERQVSAVSDDWEREENLRRFRSRERAVAAERARYGLGKIDAEVRAAKAERRRLDDLIARTPATTLSDILVKLRRLAESYEAGEDQGEDDDPGRALMRTARDALERLTAGAGA